MYPGRIIRPAGYSDDEESEFEGYDDFDYYCQNDSDPESGYDEPVSTTANVTISTSQSLLDAMKSCLLDKIEELIPQIENPDTFQLPNNMKPLQFAAQLGKPELVEYFLNQNAVWGVNDLDTIPTPLVLACSVQNENLDEDHLKCAEILLKAGSDVNFQDLYGMNALITACKSGTLDAVKLLLSSGARVDDRENDGWSPIFYAANRGDKDIVKELLKYNANFDQMDKRNRYPHTLAVDKDFKDIADLLKPEIVVRNEEASENMVTVGGTTSLSEYVNEDEPAYFDDVIGMLFGVAPDMERYGRLFREKKVTLYEFLTLKNEEDLVKIGVPLSWHRQTILSRIQQFHLSHWETSSLGLCTFDEKDSQEPKSMMKLLSYMASLRQHMLVMKASLDYLSSDIEKLISSNPGLVKSLQNMQSKSISIIQRIKQLQRQIEVVRKTNRSRLLAQQV